jgi:hypothetical protein
MARMSLPKLYLRLFWIILSLFCGITTSLHCSADLSSDFNQDSISVTYEIMDRDAFNKIVVGNTIVGITRQSHSLYMLYFASDGYCELWKQNQIYEGNWRIEKDEIGRDFVRAFWPQYSSPNQKSLFSPENPRFGTATSVWYYVDTTQPNTILLATKKFRVSLVLVPGRAFPSLQLF